MPNTTNEYKCAMCGGVFDFGWTEEEAQKEMKDNFGENAKVENMEVICDDCYKIIVPELKN